MIKLPPKIGSFNVPEALTRHVLSGKVDGKKTVKPRLGLICDHSVNVVGLGMAVGVLLAEVVPGVLPAVAFVVTVEVAPAGVEVMGACSSRKMMNGLLHQRSLDNATCGIGVFAVGPATLLPTFEPEHDTRIKLDNSRQVDRHSHIFRQRTTTDED